MAEELVGEIEGFETADCCCVCADPDNGVIVVSGSNREPERKFSLNDVPVLFTIYIHTGILFTCFWGEFENQ